MEKKTILIVDDAPENITFLKSLLGEQYRIKVAINGETALKIFNNQDVPDLILLDVVMPGMDGFEVCRRIKADPLKGKVPIIFVTSNTEPEQITKGFSLGGVDYVTKPYNSNELMARITTHLTLKDTLEKMELLAGKLGKYLSPEVYNSIFRGEQEVKVETKMKPLTVMFSDIVNFTSQVEQMSIDELTIWLNRYMNSMAEIAIKYGGTLDKFIGDAVMVFFGDPKTNGVEIDAIDCVKMAMEMVDSANELGIKIRVGINSGMCIVGNFGSENRMDYTVIGKTVNRAQRLEVNSSPARILVSEETYQLINRAIVCSNNGLINAKGVEEPIYTYWIEA